MKRFFEFLILAPAAGLALPVLLDSALKGLVLMALVLGAVLLVLRQTSAALRHLILVAAMVGLLVLPLLSLTLPGWRVLPNFSSADEIAAPRGETVQAPQADAPTAGLIATAVDISPAASPVVVAEAFSEAAVATAVVDVRGPVAESLPAAVVAPAAARVDWQALLVRLWMIGAALFGLRLALSRWALWRLDRRSRRCPDGDARLALLAESCESLGLRRKVRLIIHPQRAMPMTWGIFFPRLLLPEDSAGWSDGRCRSVLLHELAHVRRHDCLTQLLGQAVCALHWFNPLAWVACRWASAERERACDDLVLNSGVRASDYAEHLLRIATGYEEKPVTAAAALAMARKSRLEGRLSSILDTATNRRKLNRRVALAAVFCLAVVALPMAMMRAVADEKKAATKSEKEFTEELERILFPETGTVTAEDPGEGDKGAADKWFEDLSLFNDHPFLSRKIYQHAEEMFLMENGKARPITRHEFLTWAEIEPDFEDHVREADKEMLNLLFRKRLMQQTEGIGELHPKVVVIDKQISELSKRIANEPNWSPPTERPLPAMPLPENRRLSPLSNVTLSADPLLIPDRSRFGIVTARPATIVTSPFKNDDRTVVVEKRAGPPRGVLDAEQLKQLDELEAQRGAASRSYGAKHPKMIMLDQRIAAIKGRVVDPWFPDLNQKIDKLNLKIHQFRASGLGERHPDVASLRQEIAIIEQIRADLREKREAAPRAGIGVGISQSKDGAIYIGGVIPGGEAERTGKLQADDRILSIASAGPDWEFIEATGLKMTRVVELMRGEAGVPLRLKIERKDKTGQLQQFEVELTRKLARRQDAPKKKRKKAVEMADPVLLQLKFTDANVAKKAVDGLLEGSDRGRVIVDVRSNSLIYIGDEATLKLVRKMVEWLEEPQSPDSKD